ncbi:tetratricopeptide repeat protein [Mucilaginibacter sp. JRF]|uniref:tetratricopeptide repeat protein n=1 Tax=Mucilaginibacter sp. JRF TaxID=2780088 RepID=UPI00187F95C3|nr:tetratricopeptide repeat protein [Mucilaginibacter sp. JRF]MBE9585654.1 tetratricopeptide repeat protein [Mucilaginibacter sp. JRF]
MDKLRTLIFIALMMLCSSLLHAQNNELKLAQQYSTNGELQKAYEIYQKLYKQENEAYYPFYVNNLIALKKFDEAESITKKMIKKFPDESEYTLKLANIYTQKGDTDKANGIYNDMISKMPAEPGAVSMIGMQLYQSGNMEYAIKAFKQGRKLLNNNSSFSHELITLYRYNRDKASLIEEYMNFLPQNPGYASQAKNTMQALFEDADYDVLKAALFKRIQKDPSQVAYTDLLTWLFLQQKEYDQAVNQAIALNRRSNTDGESIVELCRILVENKAYDEAIRGYEYVVAKGQTERWFIPAKIELTDAKSQKITSGAYTAADLASLEQDYKDLLTQFGRTPSTVFAMKRLANLQAFKLHKLNDAQQLLQQAIALPGLNAQTLATCKLDLGDVYLLNGKPWEATLLYSQVEKDKPDSETEQDAKLRNAKLAYYTGDLEYARGQLGVLKAATSKLIANDALNLQLLITDYLTNDSTGAALKMYARADMQIFADQPEKAMRTLDSIDVKYPGNSLGDDILMAKARIMINKKDYAAASTNLKTIADTHSTSLWADDAVFMLGDLYENNLNNKELAKTYYQKIVTDYPGSLWLNEARKRFRVLRGDGQGT